MFKNISYWLVCGLFLLLVSSCGTTSYLKRNNFILLEKNNIEIISDEKIRNKGSLEYNLSTHYKQKPNTKTFWKFRTRLWFYRKNSSPADTTSWNKWVRRLIAEKPVIHQKKLTKTTAEAMKSYLQHLGYFDADVSYETHIDSSKHLAYNTYKAYPKGKYIFKNPVEFISKDSFLMRTLNDTRKESFLHTNGAVAASSYSKEVNRIVRLFRNMGYFDFSSNYVSSLFIDTIGHDVNASLKILLPKDEDAHIPYKIGKVTVFPNYNPDFKEAYELEKKYKGVDFMSVGQRDITLKTLRRCIHIIEGQPYKLENEEITKQKLNELQIYKFVSIKAYKRPDESGIVDFEILLPPKRKQSVSAELELNTANNSTLNNTSIGTSLGLGYQNKNLWKGAEKLSVNFQGGVEFALNTPSNLINAANVSASTRLNIPKFIDFLGGYTMLNYLGILSDKKYARFKKITTTKFNLSYNYLNLVNFYDYQSLDVSYGYNIKLGNKWRIDFTQAGTTYFNPNTKPAFNAILANNDFLKKSFGKQLFTGLFARSVQATFLGTPKKSNEKWQMRFSGEVSGAEGLALNSIFSPRKEWVLFNNIRYSSFAKFDMEYSYLKTISRKRAFAFRSALGMAVPFGKFSETVPYVKQFYVGGANSIRAWSIRELGPGGYRHTESSDSNSPFYQTGDIRLEMNAEYRFDMFWLIEGAIFLDMGNIWTLKEDIASRPNTQISKDFYKQIAIGTGFGFRFDLDFFIMRVDLGYPLRNNYKNHKNSYWRYSSLEELTLRDVNFNIAIGYPFQ